MDSDRCSAEVSENEIVVPSRSVLRDSAGFPNGGGIRSLRLRFDLMIAAGFRVKCDERKASVSRFSLDRLG